MAINQLKAGAALSYITLGLSNLVALLYTPYMLRMLGQSEFGLYSLVASVIAYLTILDFGFGNAIIRYTAKFRAEGKVEEQYSMFGMFLILYSIIGIVSFFAGLGLYYNVDLIFENGMTLAEIDKAKIMILIMIFNLAITFPLSIFGSIINAYEDFVFQKIISIARIILNTIAMVIILEIGYKAIGMVVVTTVFNVLTLVVNYFYCKQKIKIKIYFRKFEWGFLKEVSVYSFFIFLNIIMDRIYWSSGQFILGAYVGTAAVAVFALSISIHSMYMNFSTAISGVFLPKVISIVTKQNTEKEISNLFIRTGRIQYSILSYILIGFLIFGKSFIVLWAGNEYIESYYISLLFLIPSTVSLTQNLGIVVLQARNQMKFRSILYIIISFFSLVIQIPLVKYFGGFGAAFGVFIGLLLGQIIGMNIYYYKRQKIEIIQFWFQIYKMSVFPLIIGIIGFVIFHIYNNNTLINLVSGIILFSSIYLPVAWLYSLNDYERSLYKSLFRININRI